MPCAVILTAISVEYQAVRAHLSALSEERHSQNAIYERGTFIANGQKWEVGIVWAGLGNAGAAVEAERAITHFKPSVIIFVGVAGGIKNVALGDVVVATKVYNYESGKEKEEFEPRPDTWRPTYDLIGQARIESIKPDWLKRLSSPSSLTPKVFVEPIATGEKVIASTQSPVFKLLQKNYSDAVAVEMEGGGLLRAAYVNPQVSALVIRGISDLIDGKSAADVSGSQEIAACNASAFAFELLAKFKVHEVNSQNFDNKPSTRFENIHKSDQQEFPLIIWLEDKLYSVGKSRLFSEVYMAHYRGWTIVLSLGSTDQKWFAIALNTLCYTYANFANFTKAGNDDYISLTVLGQSLPTKEESYIAIKSEIDEIPA
jgi:nucleoside phosphorylase